MKVKLVLLFLAVDVAGLAWWYTHRGISTNTSGLTVIIASSEAEAAPLVNKLENRQDISHQVPLCPKAYTGKLEKQPTAVVVGGSAKISMTACTENVLVVKKNQIREIILTGIAGISPKSGEATKATMIGDVCINSTAVDFDRQMYSSDQQLSQIPNPVFWRSDSPDPSSRTAGSPALARELEAAAREVVWPEVPAQIAEINTRYESVSRSPQAWGGDECLEVSGDLFWHDSRADLIARTMGANWLNQVQKTNLKPNEIVVTTAMEAVPVGVVIQSWNDAYGTNIRFAYIRGASNFDRPREENGVPATDGRTSLASGMTNDGVNLAIQSEADVILKMLERRGD